MQKTHFFASWRTTSTSTARDRIPITVQYCCLHPATYLFFFLCSSSFFFWIVFFANLQPCQEVAKLVPAGSGTPRRCASTISFCVFFSWNTRAEKKNWRSVPAFVCRIILCRVFGPKNLFLALRSRWKCPVRYRAAGKPVFSRLQIKTLRAFSASRPRASRVVFRVLGACTFSWLRESGPTRPRYLAQGISRQPPSISQFLAKSLARLPDLRRFVPTHTDLGF